MRYDNSLTDKELFKLTDKFLSDHKSDNYKQEYEFLTFAEIQKNYEEKKVKNIIKEFIKNKESILVKKGEVMGIDKSAIDTEKAKLRKAEKNLIILESLKEIELPDCCGTCENKYFTTHEIVCCHTNKGVLVNDVCSEYNQKPN